MTLGRLPRGLAMAALAAVTVVPLAASAAAAAPAAPTAYSAFGAANPLFWVGSSNSLPVADLHVPAVEGWANNLPFASSEAALGVADQTSNTLSGDAAEGLTCTGYDENQCKAPFYAVAKVDQKRPEAGHAEQAAAVGGKDGKFPGSIHSVVDCARDCAGGVIHSASDAAGPAGGFPGYVSIGSSSAAQDLSMDDKGRVVSAVRSQLDNVVIGPHNEVHFSSLVTTATASGAGAENTKNGRADLRIADFYILDSRVELTPAGLRLANAGPSEQEAYDGAKALLKKLKTRGITLELPNFDAQLIRKADHVTVEVVGLRVRFEQQVSGTPVAALNHPLELGHATAVVAALDSDRHVEVKQAPDGSVMVENTAPTAAPVVAPGGAAQPSGTAPSNPGKSPKAAINPPGPVAPQTGRGPTSAPAAPGSPVVSQPAPSAGSDGSPATPPLEIGLPSASEGSGPPAMTDPNEDAIGIPDVRDKLDSLRGAHSVSTWFGAFLGLGLVLPLARFVIRRLG